MQVLVGKLHVHHASIWVMIPDTYQIRGAAGNRDRGPRGTGGAVAQRCCNQLAMRGAGGGCEPASAEARARKATGRPGVCSGAHCGGAGAEFMPVRREFEPGRPVAPSMLIRRDCWCEMGQTMGVTGFYVFFLHQPGSGACPSLAPSRCRAETGPGEESVRAGVEGGPCGSGRWRWLSLTSQMTDIAVVWPGRGRWRSRWDRIATTVMMGVDPRTQRLQMESYLLDPSLARTVHLFSRRSETVGGIDEVAVFTRFNSNSIDRMQCRNFNGLV